jgi:hypothetical protein
LVQQTCTSSQALLGFKTGFVRTPKYGIERREDTWYGKLYSIPFSAISIIELILGLYSLAGLLLFLFFSKYFISPFLFIYTAGFLYVFSLSVLHGFAQARKS